MGIEYRPQDLSVQPNKSSQILIKTGVKVAGTAKAGCLMQWFITQRDVFPLAGVHTGSQHQPWIRGIIPFSQSTNSDWCKYFSLKELSHNFTNKPFSSFNCLKRKKKERKKRNIWTLFLLAPSGDFPARAQAPQPNGTASSSSSVCSCTCSPRSFCQSEIQGDNSRFITIHLLRRNKSGIRFCVISPLSPLLISMPLPKSDV